MISYKIVFSILVHEKWDVVLDQVINYLTLNSGCAIVLHRSQKFNNSESKLSEDSFFEAISQIGDVYINPTSVRTGLYDLIQAHVSNFDYMRDLVDFEFFVPSASNEYFILPNVYDYLKGYDCGFGFEKEKNYDKWSHYAGAKNDPDMKNIIQAAGGYRILGSQIEGSFYSKSLFSRIAAIIDEYYHFELMSIRYAREEFYFSSIVDGFIHAGEAINLLEGKPFTRIDWSRDLTLSIRLFEVRRWMIDKKYYCVKRVDRVFNAAIREYVRKAYGYDNELARYVPLRSRSDIAIWCDAVMDLLTTYYGLIPRMFRKIKKLFK